MVQSPYPVLIYNISASFGGQPVLVGLNAARGVKFLTGQPPLVEDIDPGDVVGGSPAPGYFVVRVDKKDANDYALFQFQAVFNDTSGGSPIQRYGTILVQNENYRWPPAAKH